MAGPAANYTSRPRQTTMEGGCSSHPEGTVLRLPESEGSILPKGFTLASAENLRRWDTLAWVFTVALVEVAMLLNTQANSWESLEAATPNSEKYVLEEPSSALRPIGMLDWPISKQDDALW